MPNNTSFIFCLSIIFQQNKNKTPWRKVKDIIQTHRGSLKGKSRSRSVKSTSSVGCSRDASPCDSTDAYSNIDVIFFVIIFLFFVFFFFTSHYTNMTNTLLGKKKPLHV